MKTVDALLRDQVGESGATFDLNGVAAWVLTDEGPVRHTTRRVVLPFFKFSPKQLRDGIGKMLRQVAIRSFREIIRSDEVCERARWAFNKARLPEEPAHGVLRSGSSMSVYPHEMMVVGYPESIGRLAFARPRSGRYGVVVFEQSPVVIFKVKTLNRFDMALRDLDSVSEE